MRINYKILWLDDDKKFLDNGREEFIKEYLQSKGFNPQIKHYLTVKESEDNYENYDNYDLILSDFNLDPNQTGAFFINLIRRKNIITEILLYSAKPIDYKKIVNDYGYLDRITICDTIRNVDEVIEKLIDITIKKTQDISSLRGLIMSETSAIDNYIDEILQDLSITEKFKQIVDECKIEKISEIRKKLSSKAELIDRRRYDKVYQDNTLFSAKPKYDLLLSVISKIAESERQLEAFIEGIKGYETVMTIRNKFGHCKQETRDDGSEYLKIKDLQKEYDEEECIKLRKEIRDYYLNFEKLHKSIKEIVGETYKIEELKTS